MPCEQFTKVKVFSATKARERDGLGDRITEFLQERKPLIVDKIVTQSSDKEFHCLTITLFYKDKQNGERQRQRRGRGDSGRR